MPENDKVMSVGQASKYIGKTVHTLQDWDRKRKFIAHRNPINNRRFYYNISLNWINCLEKTILLNLNVR